MSITANSKLNTVGKRIKALRESLGLSQQQMGRRFGLMKSSIGKIETGENWPKPKHLVQMARDYGVSLDYLLMGRGKMYYDQFAAIDTEGWGAQEKEMLEMMKKVPKIRYALVSYFLEYRDQNLETIGKAIQNK